MKIVRLFCYAALMLLGSTLVGDEVEACRSRARIINRPARVRVVNRPQRVRIVQSTGATVAIGGGQSSITTVQPAPAPIQPVKPVPAPQAFELKTAPVQPLIVAPAPAPAIVLTQPAPPSVLVATAPAPSIAVSLPSTTKVTSGGLLGFGFLGGRSSTRVRLSQ